MTVFDRIREKNKIIAFLVRLQNSSLYPIFFAIVCIISGTHPKEVYLPLIWFLTLTVIFGGLFSKDFKIFLVAALLLGYTPGYDYGVSSSTFEPSSIFHFAICILLILAVIFYRLISAGLLKEIVRKKGLFFWGIIAIDVALVLGGAFTSGWRPINILYGILIGAGLTIFYCVFIVLLSHSEDITAYACKILVCAGSVAVVQTLIKALQLYLSGIDILRAGSSFILNRDHLVLSWGPPTITAAVMALAVPAALYLARERRFPILSNICATSFLAFIFIINTRSALIFGGVIYLVGIVFCCINGKNKTANRVYAISLVGIAIIGCAVLLITSEDPQKAVSKLFSVIRLGFLLESDSSFTEIFGSRAAIWKEGLSNFVSSFTSVIFGVGFSVGRTIEDWKLTRDPNIFDKMYHNIVIEFLGSMGLVGITAFIYHLKHGLELIFRKFDLSRILVLFVPILILSMSLLDNFFFYPNFIIVYAVFLACAELMLEKKRQEALANVKRVEKSKRPRVLFPYVEAGKGHIVPERTVCEVFKKKYGDRVEVVESNFFTETGNADMQKTEQLFKNSVESSNRSPIMGMLFVLGNLVGGDTFSVHTLLSLTLSGRKASPLAIKHLEELDADVIYTTHWSIPYYVNQLKGPRPYTISFCPDVTSNGLFDVDANNFLMSNSIGYNKVMRYRMYAGGNITQVPFPIRTDTEAHRAEGKKEELRAALGIPQDEFVVTLCDGGYGLARLEKTVKYLIRQNTPMTIIALCGMNEALARKLKNLRTPEGIKLISLGFTDKVLDYICVADLFAGKSGANSMAEPAALGVPIVITNCSSHVERSIKHFYIHTLGGGVYIPSARRAAKKIAHFAQNRGELVKYRQNLLSNPIASYDAEATADLIWQRVLEIWDRE